MAQFAEEAAANERGGSGFLKISTRGGILSVDDTPVEDNELRIVVLAAVYENQYFDQDYNPNHPIVPVCYSFSDPTRPAADKPEEYMVPHEEAEDPQSDSCAECPLNVMGSADRGRGKACKNIRRLAVITDDSLDDLESAEVRALNVPVTSVKNWAKFVKHISDSFKRPPWGVVAMLKVVPDAKSQFQLTFAFEELIEFDEESYAAMKAKIAEVQKDMTQPYPKQSDLDAMQPPAPPPRGNRGNRGRQTQAEPPAPAPKGRGRQAEAAPTSKTPQRKAKY